MNSGKDTRKTRESGDTLPSTCPECEQNRVSTTIHDHEYVYGEGESAITLQVKIPVRHCRGCDCQFTDWEAEEIMQNALCAHFGVLNPSEVSGLRNKHHLPRTEFARLTGLGEASLNRWEKGINIQSVSHDRFLRLLDDPRILSRLKQIVAGIDSRKRGMPDNIVPFPNLRERERLEIEGRLFKLRNAQ